MTEQTIEIPGKELQAYWEQLSCGFPRVAMVFPDCMAEALRTLSEKGVREYIESARFLGKMGRGAEPILIFLEEWPAVAQAIGENVLPEVMAFIHKMNRSPNSRAIPPLLQALPNVARRLHSEAQFRDFLSILADLMEKTTGSIHGHHTTFPSPGLPEMLKQTPTLLGQLSLAGIKNWVDYGVRYYSDHPERQAEYFALKSSDSRAVLQRERHGVLFADVERKLDLYMRGLWEDADQLVPYSTIYDELRKPIPYYDKLGMRVPDVFDEFVAYDGRDGMHQAEEEIKISGLDRYRAVLAHMAGHRRWSGAIIADNYSPLQRMVVEFFEDCRIETLLIRKYPGLRRIFLALHPFPGEFDCDPETMSCLRHRMTLLSRALLDPGHPYKNENICEFVTRFHEIMDKGESSTREIADLALAFAARTRRQSDQYANVYFDNTVIDYRDDNRHLWQFIEDSDDEDFFDDPDKTQKKEAEVLSLPPKHYPEWDYNAKNYRPDWVSVYEGLHPSGNAADIDKLLQKHAGLAKRLKKLLDLLKPQDKVRIRYQEDGSELDLDVAIRSLIDYKSGAQPDPRINMSHRTDGRNIAVMLLLDLSESLSEKVGETGQTILELSQEAVSLLAWAIEKLGDPFAIAGFRSNTRHDVRYMHIKGYSEQWGDEPKARIAAMEAAYSTRMGAAMRHAAHYLEKQPADKKLMLILTDGEPADIDSKDGRILIEDTAKAVMELDQKGIYSYCINLDPKADEYVKDIFGNQYSIIDNIELLPEKLPELFISLTK